MQLIIMRAVVCTLISDRTDFKIKVLVETKSDILK